MSAEKALNRQQRMHKTVTLSLNHEPISLGPLPLVCNSPPHCACPSCVMSAADPGSKGKILLLASEIRCVRMTLL